MILRDAVDACTGLRAIIEFLSVTVTISLTLTSGIDYVKRLNSLVIRVRERAKPRPPETLSLGAAALLSLY